MKKTVIQCFIAVVMMLLLGSSMVWAEPLILSGVTDVTDMENHEGYFPEIPSAASYTEYGLAMDADGNVIYDWFFDPKTKEYKKLNNEGQVTAVKENPYGNPDSIAFGTAYIQLDYEKEKNISGLPEEAQIVVYFWNVEMSVSYAFRIPYGRTEDFVELPAGEYYISDIMSYDTDCMTVDALSYTDSCYIPESEIGHVNASLQVAVNSKYKVVEIVQSEIETRDVVTEPVTTSPIESGTVAPTQKASSVTSSTASNSSGFLSGIQNSISNSKEQPQDQTVLLVIMLFIVAVLLVLLLCIGVWIYKMKKGDR